jgi:hypothetical protein
MFACEAVDLDFLNEAPIRLDDLTNQPGHDLDPGIVPHSR